MIVNQWVDWSDWRVGFRWDNRLHANFLQNEGDTYSGYFGRGVSMYFGPYTLTVFEKDDMGEDEDGTSSTGV